MVLRSIYSIKLSQAIFLGEVGEKNFTQFGKFSRSKTYSQGFYLADLLAKCCFQTRFFKIQMTKHKHFMNIKTIPSKGYFL